MLNTGIANIADPQPLPYIWYADNKFVIKPSIVREKGLKLLHQHQALHTLKNEYTYVSSMHHSISHHNFLVQGHYSPTTREVNVYIASP